MATTTKASPDKIKLLDQMLEDLAGDEFEEFDTSESSTGAGIRRHDITEDLDIIDLLH
ncbi:MAG: hypothetical protein WBL28_08760 [Methylotenera sp.]